MEKSHGLDATLLQFFKRSESYPHKPKEVRHIQTHISHVFMVPPYVYKIKKPVNFDFLDYSTLEKRQTFCHREVELNRRLCDGVYLGVVAIAKKGDTYQFVAEDEAPESVVEYAVKMKQLADEYFLHTYIDRGTLKKEHLDRVADKLAAFYLEQTSDPQIEKWGRIENIRVNTDENFNQTRDFTGETIQENAYEAIKYFTNKYFEKNQELFERRIAEERIVDGHGDLHLEHIHITPERVRIYDCIEFNDRFRYGDLAADLAYLAMDLDFNDCWREGRYFVDQMSMKLDDRDLLRIIDFYKCYRAYVKGKVKSMQSVEEEVDPKDRQTAASLARRYFDLSLRYALVGSKPVVIILMGRVGTGKSTLAGYLEEKLKVEYFSSDRIRKTMAGVPLTKRVSRKERQALYSSGMSKRTYEALMDRAIQSVADGKSVILDATFSRKEGRRKLTEALDRQQQVDYCFVEVRASDKTIKERLESRQNKKAISDARLEDFDQLNERYDPPSEIPEKHLITVDSEQAIERSLGQLYRSLIKRKI